jgi:hypothetical protein
MSGDYTKIPIQFDPTIMRMQGTTLHGGLAFDVPFISHIHGNLYVGGCGTGLILPADIRHLISLYPWERYRIQGELDSELYVKAYDAAVELLEPQLQRITDWALACVAQGKTLIHCQAGLNRSSLVAALVLMRMGVGSAREVIDLLRRQRSPAVLCNKDFERWLLSRDRGPG